MLLDVKLPDINGLEVCQRIKEAHDTQAILVLQTSASYIGTNDKIRALEGGADNYLFEPIEPEELVANVKALLRLGHVERELCEVDRRKDEFLAVLAHELRNPLGPIRNAVELLRQLDPYAPPAQEKARQTIIRQTDHMIRLVDDLLDVSRISRGKIALQTEHVSLGTIIATAVEASRPEIDARHHHLEVQLPEPDIQMSGDAVRLSQVVSNLLNNAAKFTPPGGQISLTMERVGTNVSIVVQDNGIGLDEHNIDVIFDLFSQAGHVPDQVQDGLGIGLALVKTLVELHGGNITASSAGIGKGSRFEILLPLYITSPEPEPEQALPADKGRHRILVVDDNTDAAEVIAALLEVDGHLVRTSKDGSSAIEAARTDPPEVVLLDIGLPDMSGYEVAARLRALPGMEHAFLIALTGYGQDKDRERALAGGFDRHLTKPVTFDTLKRTLSEVRRG